MFNAAVSPIWTQVLDYCEKNHDDSSIIDTLEEFSSFSGQTAVYAGVQSWIGLTTNPNETKYAQWCDGTTLRHEDLGRGITSLQESLWGVCV